MKILTNKSGTLQMGKSQVLRLNIDNVALEMGDKSSQSYFPFDEANIPLEFDFYPIKMYKISINGNNEKVKHTLLLCPNKDGLLEEFNCHIHDKKDAKQYEIKYNLLESGKINDMLQFRLDTVNGLETHNV